MSKFTKLFISVFMAMAMLLCNIQEAQAKRLGGGGSFGSKPSYSQPFQPSSPNSFSQPLRSPAQQQATAQNQAARQGLASRGGLMGMLGGLALGGLLGSLFFGGAFEHINFMDFLLFAGIAYLAYRLFAAKTAGQNQPVANAYQRTAYNEPVTPVNSGINGAGVNTDLLFNKNHGQAAAIPANFNQAEFLAGAERAFRFLQSAWDSRDLSTIRGLSTDKVFAEIQQQMRDSNDTDKTEVVRLNAQLLAVTENNNVLEASVLFESLMRENNGPEQVVKEVWHFIKPVNSPQAKWFLDGIQQAG